MVTLPVLGLPNFTQPFIVETNTSGIGLGEVFMQNNRAIAFFSQVLPPKGKEKSIYERELMAIVFAIQKWRHYLLRRRFMVRTGQRSLKFLLEQREVNQEYQRWLTKLLGFDFDIEYKAGLENKAVDALSRIDATATLMTLSIPSSVQLSEIQQAVGEDTNLGAIYTSLRKGQSITPGYNLLRGHLLYNNRPSSAKRVTMGANGLT